MVEAMLEAVVQAAAAAAAAAATAAGGESKSGTESGLNTGENGLGPINALGCVHCEGGHRASGRLIRCIGLGRHGR